jgi:hypothetical protein
MIVHGYRVEEQEPYRGKHVREVRIFTFTGKRGAVYGCLVYQSAGTYWTNLTGKGPVPTVLRSLDPTKEVAL